MDVNQWPSDNIRPLRFINLPRAHAIAEQLNDPNAPLSRELSAHIAELNGGDAQSLWDKYFTAYDKIVGFTQGFWDIATAANNILPRAGKIADFGAGTGNISTLLGISTPDRDIYALDFSPRGLEIAREKFLRIPNSNPKHFHIQFFDLTKSDYPANEYDGAVMSNVLYNFEKQQKLEILKNIFKSLKPGAPFVLNDPIECSPEQLTQFLESTVYDSMRAGAHVNEYEFAFLAKINISVLFTKHFLSLSELRSLASEAGFEVLGDRESYYGVARFLYLRKPPVAAQ